jgi:hypothetical protein
VRRRTQLRNSFRLNRRKEEDLRVMAGLKGECREILIIDKQ